MEKKILSVFVDESGKFLYPDAQSRFYIVGMVFHDQSFDASNLIQKLDDDWQRMGLAAFSEAHGNSSMIYLDVLRSRKYDSALSCLW